MFTEQASVDAIDSVFLVHKIVDYKIVDQLALIVFRSLFSRLKNRETESY